MRCDLRGTECACHPSECRASPPTTLAESIMVPSWKTQLITYAWGLALMFSITLTAAYIHEQQLKNSDLDRQEMTHVVRR